MTELEEETSKDRIITQSKIYPNVNTESTLKADQTLPDDFVFGEIQNYEISKPIGSGKYSTVFLGFNKSGQKCAIKILKPIPIYKICREINILKKVQKIPNAIQVP